MYEVTVTIVDVEEQDSFTMFFKANTRDDVRAELKLIGSQFESYDLDFDGFDDEEDD